MEALITNLTSNANGIFAVGKAFTTWAISDELVGLGLTLTIIGFVASLVVRTFHRA